MGWRDNFSSCLLLSTAISTFGSSMLFGYNIGVLNTPRLIIKQFYRETYASRSGDGKGIDSGLIDFLWALTVSIYVAAGMIGAFSTAAIADKFGRKGGILFNHIFMLIGALIEGLSKVCKAPEMLIIGRAFVGFNCGMTVGMVSLYLTEISPQKVRGAIGSCHQLLTTIGIFVSQILGLKQLFGSEELWPLLMAFSGFPALISLCVLPFFPESPRYLLLKKGDKEGARAALVRLRGTDDVSGEIEEMEEESRESRHHGKFAIKQLFMLKELRLPLIIAVLIQVTQQWSGINAIFFYSESTFEAAGVPSTSIPYAVLGTGAMNVLITIIAVPLVEKLGRRPLLIIPMIVMAVSCVVVTISLNLQVTYHWMSYITIVFIIVYVIGFAIGLGPIPAFVVSELFRQEPRPAAHSVAQFTNWFCNFVLALCFPFMQEAMGVYTFLVFLAVIIATLLFIFFFVPETKNRTFDEIAQHLAFGRAGQQQPTSVLLQDKREEDRSKTDENKEVLADGSCDSRL